MDKNSAKYTFGFALAVCVVCSFTLSLVSEGLRSKKELNVALDIKKNILKAVSLREPLPPKATAEQILSTYDEKISEIVVDSKGNLLEDKTAESIQEGEEAYPLYVYKEGQTVVAYCFPIVGQGLWSTLYGYFAIEPDAKTVRGITYYAHGETPGLGAEIEKDWFQDNFKGKSIWDIQADALKPVAVVKGKVSDQKSEEESIYYVDGISGATITSNGVTEMIHDELHKYEPYFSNIRK